MGFEDFDQMDTWDAGKTAGGRHGSMPSKRRMKNLTDKVNGKSKRTVTYEGGYEAPGMHNVASKTVSTQGGARYGKGKTKTLSVTDDTPYHGRRTSPSTMAADRETLTRTKTVNKGYGPRGGTKTTEHRKAITEKRAARIKKRIRKHDPSEKSSKSYYENR